MERSVTSGEAIADNLAAGAHVVGVGLAAAERAKIGHPALPGPGERTVCVSNSAAPADDLAAWAYCGCIDQVAAKGDAEGAEIDHPAGLCPRERVDRGVAGGAAVTDNLAGRAYRVGGGEGAAEGAEIDDSARLCPRKRVSERIGACAR